MVVNQRVAMDVLSKIMVPGKRYFVKDLQNLFRENYHEWEDVDFNTDNSIGESWEMHVKNCVRMSPCRPPETMASWPELKCRKDGRKWSYWIEPLGGGVDGEKKALPKISSRKRPRPNDGWNAERFVKRDLEDRGFDVIEVSSGGFGCDLIAKRWGRTIRVEVKSSIGPCSPTLTQNEWDTAKIFREDYVLAILDNFEPEGGKDEHIYYLHDPVSLDDKEGAIAHFTTTNHRLHRHAWSNSLGANLVSGPTQHGANECLHYHDSELHFLHYDKETVSIDILMECKEETCGKRWTTNVLLEEFEDDWVTEDEGACFKNPGGACELGSAEWNELDIEAYCVNCGSRIWHGYVGNAYWNRAR
jgi:hypothetical protein